MNGTDILKDTSGEWTFPDMPAGSYTLFFVEPDSWKPLCPKVTVTVP